MQTNTQKIFSLLYMTLLILTVSCAHKSYQKSDTPDHKVHNTYDGVQSVSNSAATESGAKKYVEIKFPQGGTKLQADDKKSLSELLEMSSLQGEIDEVLVLSWSDQEYPSKRSKRLSKGQRELAQRRNFEVKSYLKQLKNVDVETYNMAERPGSFARLLDTDDQRLKETLVTAGLATNTNSRHMIKKSSHSVVLVTIKD
jgi:hypothetical protein